MQRKQKPTTDAIEILDRRYHAGRPKRQAELEHARIHALIGLHAVYLFLLLAPRSTCLRASGGVISFRKRVLHAI